MIKWWEHVTDMIAWEKDSAAYRAQRVSCVFDRRHDEDNSKKWQGWKIGNLRAFNEEKLKELTELNEGLEICSNIMKVQTQKSDRGLHPTQKAVKLMEILISLVTVEGQVVLDPFCGCGTTLVAARNLSREYIGFEINEEYYNNILKRLESQQ